jgi:hypothetical protein
VCNKILEDAGILGDVSVEELPLYFIPLEQDLLSLELQDSFSDLYLRKDPTCIHTAARALMQMQRKHGLFPRIIGKGDNAHRLMALLLRMRAEAAAEEPEDSSRIGTMPSSFIESLILIDREVDFGTVLLTQLTYEGLIDELYGIKDNQADLDISIVGPPPGQQNPSAPIARGMKRKVLLDSSDKLYEQLRDANFATVGPVLNKVARRLESDFDSRHTAKSTSELRDFVTKLPGFQAEQQSLKIHTGLAEDIMKQTRSDLFTRALQVQQNLVAGSEPTLQHDSIEELIARDAPLPMVLRLLCLESCVTNGLKPKDLEHFRRLILHAYGYQHLLTLDSLAKIGLLIPRQGSGFPAIPGTGNNPSNASTTKTNYAYLRKSLRLIYDDVNETSPDDIAYVYSGYAPLSVRLVQAIIQKSHLLAFTKSPSSQPQSQTSTSTSASQATTTNGISPLAHGWQGFEDPLKSLRGQTFNKIQKAEEGATKARTVLGGSSAGTARGERKMVVVMFLGGITRTEISALRFLANGSDGEAKRKILICTTGVVSGNGVVESAMEKGGFVKHGDR